MMNITSMNGSHLAYAYGLEIVKETARSIYAESTVYGWVYRVEKNSGRVFLEGKKIADTCTYDIFR